MVVYALFEISSSFLKSRKTLGGVYILPVVATLHEWVTTLSQSESIGISSCMDKFLCSLVIRPYWAYAHYPAASSALRI